MKKKLMHTLRTLYTGSPHQSFKALVRQGLYPQALKASILASPSPSPSNPNLTDQTYALFIKSGHHLDPFLATIIISHFSKLGDLSRAQRFLFDIPFPDTVSYNALIAGFARFLLPRPVFELFDLLRHVGLRPDDFTLSSLVKASNSLEENEIAHGVCMRLGFGSSAYLVSGLIENYARNGVVGSAEKCFGDCLVVDNVVLTAMVCGYVWNGEFEKGKNVFSGMWGLGLELNEFSLTGVLGALHVVREGEQIHGIGFKMGLLFGSSVHLSNAIMTMYSRCGNKLAALKMFDEIIEPDVVSWTERIGAAYDDAEALKLFKILHSEDLEINEYTIINVVSAIAGLWMLRPGEQIQALSQKAGHFHAVSVSNAFVSMYGKCGQMDNARCIFDNMLCRDSVSWNSLIAGYSENRLDAQAFEMFCQMRNFFPPDRYTLASILEIVSNFNSATLATQIHCHVIKLGFMMDDHVISCLITTYGKCNLINESKGAFAEVYKPNVELLNAMTTTFVRAGCHADALTLFRTSRCLCLEVDSTTFCTILKACGATSDLEQGRVIHCLAHKAGYDQDSFVETSIIDIYCKCGNIGDAEKSFWQTSKDNLASWNAMMMGYAQHGFHCQLSRLFNKMSEFDLEPDEISYLRVHAAIKVL